LSRICKKYVAKFKQICTAVGGPLYKGFTGLFQSNLK